MDQTTEEHIRNIYTNHLVSDILNQFILHLDHFWHSHSNVLLPIKTVGINGKALGYFDIFHIAQPTQIILLAGAIDSDEHRQRFPVIRIDIHNSSLHFVLPFTFPYGKTEQLSNTVNVKLCKDTINSVPALFESQLEWFTQQYVL